MAKNITYLLGAGASYNACPILNEQGRKMIELAKTCSKFNNEEFLKKPDGLTLEESVLWDIGYFGKKAIEFGTIDTYAKKLDLNRNNSIDELKRLKVAVSIFFTIWQLTNDEKLKTLDRPILKIDQRYISLLASVLENKDNNIGIKENINFVTWNYDLQLEYAFKSFCQDTKWDALSDILKFRVIGDTKLQVCHLNGYHGFYKTSTNEHHILERTDKNKIEDILKEIVFISKSQDRETIDITGYINYAWENSEIVLRTREEAKRIFSQTDILIIIGYSFPNFNKDIDKSLFKELNRYTKIYFQDPNATDEFISELFNKKDTIIRCLNKKLDYFFLPYSF